MKLVFASAASREAVEARTWYDQRREGLGEEFQRAFQATAEALLLHPEMYQVAYKSRRRAFIRRFPYFLLYEVVGDAIIILGCIHMARNPAVWRRRGDA